MRDTHDTTLDEKFRPGQANVSDSMEVSCGALLASSLDQSPAFI